MKSLLRRYCLHCLYTLSIGLALCEALYMRDQWEIHFVTSTHHTLMTTFSLVIFIDKTFKKEALVMHSVQKMIILRWMSEKCNQLLMHARVGLYQKNGCAIARNSSLNIFIQLHNYKLVMLSFSLPLWWKRLISCINVYERWPKNQHVMEHLIAWKSFRYFRVSDEINLKQAGTDPNAINQAWSSSF